MEQQTDLADRYRRETRARRLAEHRGLVATKSRRRFEPGRWFVIDPATRTLALGPTDLDDLEEFLGRV